ncbi:MAG TPA: malto-oligosyltrehalose synthase [Candidatus Binatia bacterium]|jgi:(1->4)-alpha-D-glucan 1-alpha-D-glucosylmutase|nr:malto-oligosyltrehalose synthase [Candidatus Binatia bacterium]
MRPKRSPLATYRWQFNNQFTFRQALAAADYLSELGISDCYASPLFKAEPQSTHGYDICGFDQFNPNLGSAAEFEQMAARLERLGLGLLLDIVPNHMAADPSNPWWLDVLEKGPASRYATWFDIDWRPLDPTLHNRVLLPVLEARYDEVLEAGKLRLVFEQGRLWLAYYEKRFPLSPHSTESILASTKSPQEVSQTLTAFNGQLGCPRSFDKLRALLRQQHYRLAHWKLGPHEINYRRFFDITGLVSLRMESLEVFQSVHEFVFRLIETGKVTGLRIDHPDGLWDPKQYLERLRQKEGTRAPFFIVVEKILTGEERLSPGWPVEGTTGYDFLSRTNGLFVNCVNRSAFDELYRALTGSRIDVHSLVCDSKKQILQTSFISELSALAHRLKRLATATRYGQDFSLSQLHSALTEVICAFPVYRTYVAEDTRELSPTEQDYILQAIDLARPHLAGKAENQLLDFIRDLLLLHPPKDLDETGRQEAREFVMRFQQFTAPVMAKGLEDTAFYNFNRLVSLNEVGGNPGTFGISLEDFHKYNLFQSEHWPHSLLATATHDTKRGEDARAHINVLSEMPEEWRDAVTRWQRLNADKKSLVDGRPAPHPNDEYLLYQMLVGTWSAASTAAELARLAERIVAYMLKAVREAKARTSWLSPNAAYEEATKRFVDKLLTQTPPNSFLEDFKSFQRRVAFFGRFNSLSQVLLKLTAPGVPDFYQGTELWDFSLVDPDNRQPVDYEVRRRFLHDLKTRLHESPDMPLFLARLLQESATGQIKLYLIWQALELRRRCVELFKDGTYVPLLAVGTKQEHVCAFARILDKQAAIVIAPRLVMGLTRGAELPPMGTKAWQDTALPLPKNGPSRYRNTLTREIFPVGSGVEKLLLATALAHFPVALLEGLE